MYKRQVPEPVKTKRSAELLALEKEMSKAYRASFLGRETEVLLEEPVEIGGARYMVGHTKEYVKAAVPEACLLYTSNPRLPWGFTPPRRATRPPTERNM